ncbi:MAG: ankyrin repeat domain-containing protein [Candidatus Anstonellales archaeon]
MEKRKVKKRKIRAREEEAEVLVEERKGSIVERIAEALREGKEDRELFDRFREINRKRFNKSDELQQLLYESEGSLEGPIMLLLKGADPNGWGAKKRFTKACLFNEKEVALLLVEAGMKLNELDNSGLTPLIKCINEAINSSIAKLLLERGADPNKKSADGWSPFMWAFSVEAFRIAKMLEKNGADKEYLRDNIDKANMYGFTMLTYAILNRGRSKRVIEKLLEEGAGINVQDMNGKTALMTAAEEGKNRLVELLLEKGANPFCKNEKGRDAFLLAKKVSTGRIIREHISKLKADDRKRMENEAELMFSLLTCNSEKAAKAIEAYLNRNN